MKTWLALALPCLALMACRQEPSRKTAEETSAMLGKEAAHTEKKEEKAS